MSHPAARPSRRPVRRRVAVATFTLSALLGACSDGAIGKGSDIAAAPTDVATDASPDSTSEVPTDTSSTDAGPATPAFARDLTNRGGSRALPLDVGGETRVGDDWDVRLVGYDPDATQEVLDFNEGNQPPPAGQVLALARIEATYVGSDAQANAFLGLEWMLVDDEGTTWTDADCGVLPDDLASQSGVPQGETANGTICFAVDEDRLDEVVLAIAPLLGPEPTRRWWLAPPSGGGAVLGAAPEPDGSDGTP